MKSLITAMLLGMAFVLPAQAGSVTHNQVTIADPWARATPGKAANGAAYLTIRNGGKADRLVAARSGVSKRTELHTHINENGVMRMREIDGLDLPHGAEAVFKPHGYHVMFIGLKSPLKEGQTIGLTLTFEKAGDISFELPVMPVGHKGSMAHGHKKGHGHSHGHGHGKMKDKKSE